MQNQTVIRRTRADCLSFFLDKVSTGREIKRKINEIEKGKKKEAYFLGLFCTIIIFMTVKHIFINAL